MANKEYKMTPKTEAAFKGLEALGGSATFAELKAYLKDQGETVGTANLTSLAKAGFLTTEKVEVERVSIDKVNKYTLTPVETEDTPDAE